jgi:hypothetical protein
MEEPLAQLEFVQDSWLGYRVEDTTAYIRWLFLVGSAVEGASIVGSFVTLGAWKRRWLSWSSYRTNDPTPHIVQAHNEFQSRPIGRRVPLQDFSINIAPKQARIFQCQGVHDKGGIEDLRKAVSGHFVQKSNPNHAVGMVLDLILTACSFLTRTLHNRVALAN